MRRQVLMPEATRMVDLYETYGYSCSEIGEETGWHESTVRKTLRALDVPMRPRGGVPGKSHFITDAELERFRAMYEDEGLSFNEIAEQEGMLQNSVRWRLSRAGVQKRTPAEGIRLRCARRGKNMTSAYRAAALRNLELAHAALKAARNV
jgi:hypothetical protein